MHLRTLETSRSDSRSVETEIRQVQWFEGLTVRGFEDSIMWAFDRSIVLKFDRFSRSGLMELKGIGKSRGTKIRQGNWTMAKK